MSMNWNKETKSGVTPLYYTLLALALLFWASAFVGIRVALHSYSPTSLALLRFIVASVFLLIYALIAKIKLPKTKDLPWFIAGGVIGIAGYHIALNYGEQTVTAATASFLIATIPMFTGILSIFFLNEKLKTWGWIGIFISLLGVGLISFSEGKVGEIHWGALMVIISAITAGFYNMAIKKLLRYYKPIEVTIITIWVGTLSMLIFLPDLINELPHAQTGHTLVVVYLGIFPAALAYIFWTLAVPQFKTVTQLSTFLYLNPILTMIIGIIWINEMPGIMSVTGGLIALLGVVITNTKGHK